MASVETIWRGGRGSIASRDVKHAVRPKLKIRAIVTAAAPSEDQLFAREVEPRRLIHEHSDSGPLDNYYRRESDGDATRLVVESDYEMPGKLPGFIKDMMSKGWAERNMNNMLADFKALAEAEAPVSA